MSEFDWNPMPQPEPAAPAVFDPTWPYKFKWGLDAQTGRFDMWRTEGGGIDGRPFHRGGLERLWGRPPYTQGGDVLGVGQYIPAERKLDGTVVAPPVMELQAYYGQPVPQEAHDWVEQNFPGVVAVEKAIVKPRLGKVITATDDFDWSFSLDPNTVVKWVWNRKDGALLWAVDSRNGKPDHSDKIEAEWNREQRPDDILGYAIPEDGRVEMESYRPTVPPVAVSTIKTELAKMFPNDEVLVPDYLSGHEQTFKDPSKLTRRQASVEWANNTLVHASSVPVEAPESPVEATEEKTDTGRPPFLVSALRRVMGLPVVEAKEADKEGAMIAVFIPEEVGKKILQKGGEPLEDLHITLAYFEDKAADRDDWEQVKRLVEQIANQRPPLTGKIGGVGIFQNDGDGDILWASPNVPGLAELRQEIVEACEDAGFPLSKEHGWSPHITLKYDHKGKLPKLPELELKLDELSFARGDDQDHFEFKGAFEKEASSWDVELNPWRKLNPDTGFEEEYGPHTWSGWRGAHRFVTDGKEILTEPESELGGFHGPGHPGLESKFMSYYPEVKYDNLYSGWVIPTKDQMGYGIHGYFAPGSDKGPGLHEVMHIVDKTFGKPSHFINDYGSLGNSELYDIYPEGGWFVGWPEQ